MRWMAAGAVSFVTPLLIGRPTAERPLAHLHTVTAKAAYDLHTINEIHLFRGDGKKNEES